VEGKAFIPAPTQALKALYRINRELLAFRQARAPQKTATVDMDATLVETHKRLALFCYQGYAAYQSLTLYWHEQGVVLGSEFRDGNVPAGLEPVRVLAESLQALPKGVEQVRLRTDTAGYDHKLLRFCAEGRSDFGVIEFAIGVDVTPAFKAAVAEVSEWQPLSREVEGRREPTGQEWAEVCLCRLGRRPRRMARTIASSPFASPWSRRSCRGWSRPSYHFRRCCLKRAAIRCLGW
jgi:hypothetical protein